MRFALDDDQIAFRDTVRDLLAKECPPEVVRTAWTAPPGALERGPWPALAELGVLSIMTPESAGGLGLDEQWLLPLLVEAGRVALPHPLVETSLVAPPIIAGRVAPDAVIATDLGGPHVPAAADADHLLLVTPDDELHLVDRADVTVRPLEAVDRARRLGTVDWDPSSRTLITADPEVLALACDRGALGSAALLVGLGERMLDVTVDHVTGREQFGAPIGSFQAVKHHLADVARALTFARPALSRAAWSCATGAATRTRDVSVAKALAADAAHLAGRAALQCHGAIGYTVEHDLHLNLKRSWAVARWFGDAAHHRDRVGEAISV